MLIDINAYTGHWPFQQVQYNTLDGLLDRMNRFGVDKSVVANLNGIFYKNTQSANEELFSAWNSSPVLRERIVPFAVINPAYAGAIKDLEICKRVFGMRGIRLYPKYHDYSIVDNPCIDVVKRARDLGMVIALTLRMVDFRQRSWMDIEDEWALRDVIPLIDAVPDAKFMILNIANGPSLDERGTSLLKESNVLMDTSGRAITDLSALVLRYGEDKFAFGTHAPINDYLTGLLRLEAMRDDELSPAIKKKLRSANAQRMLKL